MKRQQNLKRVFLEIARGHFTPSLPGELAKVVGDAPGLVAGLWEHVRNRTSALYIMGEQVPDRDSRVTLSARRDALGMERAHLDWRLASIDKVSVRVLVALADAKLRRLKLGRAVPDEWLQADDVSWPDGLTGGFHHMGTTRMGIDPGDSVVDPNAKVHGIRNLFVAGSSIIPTVGCANPTLTIVATSLKLSDHLVETLTNDSQRKLIPETLALERPSVSPTPPSPA